MLEDERKTVDGRDTGEEASDLGSEDGRPYFIRFLAQDDKNIFAYRLRQYLTAQWIRLRYNNEHHRWPLTDWN